MSCDYHVTCITQHPPLNTPHTPPSEGERGRGGKGREGGRAEGRGEGGREGGGKGGEREEEGEGEGG